jgi:DNA-binding NarL/FixJ family response regulator
VHCAAGRGIVSSHDTHRLRAVIADDHPQVGAALKRLLLSCCEVVAIVSNGGEAVEAIIRLNPDVAIVDLMMPDMNGLEVCRRVKQLVPQTDVVMTTAFDDPQVHAKAIEVGAAAVVPKHRAADELESTIRRIFAERNTEPDPAQPAG